MLSNCRIDLNFKTASYWFLKWCSLRYVSGRICHVELQHHLKMYWSRDHKPLPSEHNRLFHHGRNCLRILFFDINTDNRILVFWIFIYQLVNPFKLFIPVFTGFHSDSFLHFSLYKTMFLQKLFYLDYVTLPDENIIIRPY